MADSSVTVGPGSNVKGPVSGIDFSAVTLAQASSVVVVDATAPDNPIVFINPAFSELTGYAPAETIGRNCRFLQGRETDRGVVAELRAALSSGQPIRREIRNYRKDGSNFWTDLAISPLHDARGALVGFVGSLMDITARKEARTAERAAEEQLSGVVNNVPGYVFQLIVNSDGAAYYKSVGGPFRNAAGAEIPSWARWGPIHPDDADGVAREVAAAVITTSTITTEFRRIAANGEIAWIRSSATPRRLTSGETVWDGIGVDITREKGSEARLASIVDNMPGYVFQRVQRPDGTVTFPYFSPSFARIVGLPPGAVVTLEDFEKVIPPADAAAMRRGVQQSAADLSQLMLEFRLIGSTGGQRWIRTYSSPKRDEAGTVVWDGVGVDVTAEKEIAIRLEYLARHDTLTGLLNRDALVERLIKMVEATRDVGTEIALSHLLLVDFSEINETLGTHEGDAALRGVATRLSEIATHGEGTLVARLSDTEFAILRHGADVSAEADDFADVIIRGMAQPILAAGQAVTIEPCIGIAVLNSGDLGNTSAEAAASELMKQAAIALSAATKDRAGARRRYDEDLDHRIRHRMQLRHSMREAIERGEFDLHYQPLVDLQSGRIVSAEALIRWQHPELGLLRPDLFIPLADESGLIGPLSEWVMRTAMNQVGAWTSKRLNPPKVAINISSVHVRMPDFIETVRRVLYETGADARRFELELTEGVLLERSPETVSALLQLKLLGFSLVIDDFGAGHSSFQYLRNFPIDKIKIDQMFVRQLVVDSSDALIVRAIASLARNLKLGIVAEGIETAEQRDFLREQGCTTGQGYFFSLPLTAEDFSWMLEQNVTLPITTAPERRSSVRTARRNP
jgi:PAS domain S-box-containing protein/diguanylate cyclase (GGDEF)-like protein